MVSLLSGRDFETREFKEEIVEDSYKKLDEGIQAFINEYHFEQFILAIKGAGFKSSKLLNSKMTLDFAYYLFLKLSDNAAIPKNQVKRYVKKWFVLSTLTGRYIGSPETVMSRDIRSIEEKGLLTFFGEIEHSALPDTFWEVTLPQNLETSSVNSPAFNTFLAAQINLNKNSLFMHGTMISDLLEISGDVHHIFPKAYLKNNGVKARSRYNQVANYTYLDTQVNKEISDDSPANYFQKIMEQFSTGKAEIGNIMDRASLDANIAENALPPGIINMTIDDYDGFLSQRRHLMAKMIEEYYKNL